jgi:NAD(P)H-flavin reductase
MFRIVRREDLNATVCFLKILAPDISRTARAGQFLVLRIDESGERIPLTIYDFDKNSGTVSLVVQKVGKTTNKLCSLKKDDYLIDLVGPLGKPAGLGYYKKVLFVGGGVGAAEVYPVARAFREKGAILTIVVGARTKDILILEKELSSLSDKFHITTDDGSYGQRGFVTDVVSEILKKESFDLVYAIGPLVMMQAVAESTRPHAIKTLVSLNSIMVDGTGMCGTCRVSVGGEVKFTCVDGPEFDGHLVDFEELMKRQTRFTREEEISLRRFGECVKKK